MDPQNSNNTTQNPTSPNGTNSATTSQVDTSAQNVEIKQNSPNQKVEEKEEKLSKEEKKFLQTMNTEGGINLIPSMTDEEKEMIERKGKFNTFAAFLILFLVIITIGVLGFNIFMNMRLDAAQDELKQLENEVTSSSTTLRSNSQLLDRVYLYRDVQESTLSPKEVLVYWRELTADYGEIETVELEDGLQFVLNGSTDKLTEVAFLWHKLSIDDRVSNINLKSVSQDSEGNVSYSFEGDLNFDYFRSDSESN